MHALHSKGADLRDLIKSAVVSCLRGMLYRILSLAAKAATVLCAIGIGFGIGSYLLYKLYCRLFPSDPKDKDLAQIADKYCSQRGLSNDVSKRVERPKKNISVS